MLRICRIVAILLSGSFLWLVISRYSRTLRSPPERALSSTVGQSSAVNSLSVAKVLFFSEVCTNSVSDPVHNKSAYEPHKLCFYSMCLRGDYQYSSTPRPMERVPDTIWLSKTEYSIHSRYRKTVQIEHLVKVPLEKTPHRFCDPRSGTVIWGNSIALQIFWTAILLIFGRKMFREILRLGGLVENWLFRVIDKPLRPLPAALGKLHARRSYEAISVSRQNSEVTDSSESVDSRNSAPFSNRSLGELSTIQNQNQSGNQRSITSKSNQSLSGKVDTVQNTT